MIVDSVLSLLLGVAVLFLAVWGGVVAVKTLPESDRAKRRDLWLFIGVGLIALIVTIFSGIRGYYSQRDAKDYQAQLTKSLNNTTTLLNQTKASLDQGRLTEEYTKGQMDAFTGGFARWASTNQSNFGVLLEALRQAGASARQTSSRYQTLTAPQLRRAALQAVEALVQLSLHTDMEDGKIHAERQSLISEERPDPAALEQLNQRELSLYVEFNQQYDKYRTNVEALRDELLRREGVAPDREDVQQVYSIYERPVNSTELRTVADDLEKLATRLPDEQNPGKR
jgi:hypothetical protein